MIINNKLMNFKRSYKDMIEMLNIKKKRIMVKLLIMSIRLKGH